MLIDTILFYYHELDTFSLQSNLCRSYLLRNYCIMRSCFMTTDQSNDKSVFQNFRIRSVAIGNFIDDNFQGLAIYVSKIIALHLMMQSMMYNNVCIFSFNLLESLFILTEKTVI